MGFSTQKYRKENEEKPWDIHPIWRGIGCALIILIPIMAWFGAALLLQNSQQIPYSYELSRPVTFHYSGVPEIDQVIADFNHYTVANNLSIGQFLFTFLLTFIGFGLVSMVYAIMMRAAGPSRYGPFDIPPNMMRK
jgi:hypothetical protein